MSHLCRTLAVIAIKSVLFTCACFSCFMVWFRCCSCCFGVKWVMFLHLQFHWCARDMSNLIYITVVTKYGLDSRWPCKQDVSCRPWKPIGLGLVYVVFSSTTLGDCHLAASCVYVKEGVRIANNVGPLSGQCCHTIDKSAPPHVSSCSHQTTQTNAALGSV